MKPSPRSVVPGTLALLCAGLLGVTSHAAPPLRVLILSGQNNHHWQETTPRLKAVLEASGRFQADVTERPDTLTAAMLAPYAVLVGNWNTFGGSTAGPAITNWPAPTRTAYLDFVRRGGGHVMLHAGSSSFYDWVEYQQLCLATWKMGQTRHGPPHRFPVRMDIPDHPITAGLRGFEHRDELWVAPGVQPGATVIASGFARADHPQGSGGYEPVALVGRFGEGRSFALLLGHDASLMEQPGYQALLVRGTEWAATGTVTLPVPAELSGSADTPARAEPSLRWARTPESVALQRGPQVLWQFNHRTGDTKPCFHPVALPDRPVLTSDQPADHRWHRALWFSWKYLNGVNYWEEDKTSGKPAGLTEWSQVQVETRPDFSARITLDLTYRPGTGAPVLTEKRRVEVSAPDATGTYFFDWDLTFTAGASDVVLDRTPPADVPGKRVFGGYAGLSVRLAAGLQEIRPVTAAGPVPLTANRYRGNAAALDYAGSLEGREMGIAVIDHPANLNAPAPWYVIAEPVMHFFSPALLSAQPHTLRAGQAFSLRYRVLIHPDRWDPARLEAETKRFVGR